MNIYVGNINFKSSEDQIREVFEEFGEVTSVKIIMDRETGRSRGFGFVEMSDEDDAKDAIDELNGAEVDGKALVVNPARPRKPMGGGGGGGGYRRPYRNDSY
ncbi:MAG: RNA-binding protein [Bernardetiaceae bacterium]|nr:RNA-binding protein [Bernardetiaceae bacterium]